MYVLYCLYFWQDSPISKRTRPLSLEEFHKSLDTDGRLVDESTLRRTVFLGKLYTKKS